MATVTGSKRILSASYDSLVINTSLSLGGANVATQSYVNTAISNLVASAPSTLDTLNELAAALGDDPNFATTVTNSIAGKLSLTGGTLSGTLLVPELRTNNGQQIVINAGESHAYATGQTGEYVYANAEAGLQVNTSPDNWGTGWAGRQTTTISGASIIINGNTAFHDGYHPNADKWTTARTNTVTLTGDVTGSGSASVDGTGNWTVSLSTAVGNDSHSHSFDGLTGKTSGTGDYSTNGDLVAGRGSGSIALTINDGKGNSNVTFNHQNGVPDQNGNAARIEVNTDSTSGASMNFELKSNVTGGTSVDLTSILNLSESQVTSYKTLYENSDRVFTDAYHPNADKWTTSRTNTVTLTGDVTGSGSASVDGSGNWTVNVSTAVGNNSHTHDTIDVQDVRNTTPLPSGLANKQVQSFFNNQTIPNGLSGWYSTLTVKGWDGTYAAWELAGNATSSAQDGLFFRYGSTSWNAWQRVFTDAYHPNADKWTTARTETINLTGDVTGTGSASVDGSNNWTINISTAVGNDSHTHNKLVENSTITYGASYLQWTDLSGTGGTGANGSTPQNPTNDWYHHIIANHSNSGGYYFDISLPFHQDEMFFRRVTNGSQGAFRKIWHDGNFNPSNYQPAGNYDNYGSWTAKDHDGTTYTVTSGDTLWFKEGGAIDVNFTADDELTISHADTSSQGSVNNSNGVVIQDVTLDGYGHVTGLNSVNLDGRYYTKSEVNTFIDRSYVSSHSASNLAVGWYTIATNTGDRASARFAIWDTNSSDHQAVVFYAAHHFGTDASNTLTVIDNSYYSGNPFRHIRIKDNGTYDGAALQIYIDDASNSVSVAIVGDNIQSSGWVIKDWVADATDPGDLSNYGSFGERSRIDLNQIAQGGFATTGEIYAGGDTTQHRVFHDAYHPNADKWTTARTHTVTLTGDVTGTASQSVDGTGNRTWTITTAVANDSHTHGNYLGAVLANGYWGMATPAGSTSDWIRTSSLGIIPYQSGVNAALGTSSWIFGSAYVNNLYASIMYDRNDTAYYVDPASTSQMLHINMNNGNLTNVNNISIADPGPGEGITWAGGNGWSIYESPNDLTTNSAGNLQFVDSGVYKFRIDTSGNTFSETSSRAQVFYDSNNTSYYCNPAGASRFNQTDTNYCDIVANAAYGLRFWDGNSGYRIHMSSSTDTTNGGRVAGETTSDYNMYFTMASGTNRGFVFRNTNYNTGAIAGIDASGNGRFEGNVVAYSASDRRLKENIKPITGALDKVSKLGGYEFDWNDKQTVWEAGKHDVGVIAQEVQEVVPEAAKERMDGYLGVDYERLVPVLIEAIKELKAEVSDLKTQLSQKEI